MRIRRLPDAGGSVLRGAVPFLIIALSAAIAWARIPPLARDTFWAEDGRTFVQAAIDTGPITSLFHPYAGYLHLLPRTLASLTVTLVPVVGWAQAMTALSCAVAGLVAGVVYICSADIVTWPPARVTLAILTVLTPLAAREVLGNAANLHSLLMWMTFWILLYRPRRARGAVVLSVLIAVAALTEIQTAFLLPVLLYRWRESVRWMPRAAFVAAVAAQLITTLLTPRASSHAAPVDPASIAYGYLINAVMPSWMPANGIGAGLVAYGPWLGIALFLVCVAAGAVAFAWGRRAQRWVAISMLALSILVWVASVLIDPAPFYDYARMNPSQLAHPWLSRYGVIPGMLLLAELVLGLSVLHGRLRHRGSVPRKHLATLFLVVGIVAVAVLSLPGATRRSSGPAWGTQVLASGEACEHPRMVPTVTLDETLGWTVTVPCVLIDPVPAAVLLPRG